MFNKTETLFSVETSFLEEKKSPLFATKTSFCAKLLIKIFIFLSLLFILNTSFPLHINIFVFFCFMKISMIYELIPEIGIKKLKKTFWHSNHHQLTFEMGEIAILAKINSAQPEAKIEDCIFLGTSKSHPKVFRCLLSET